MAEKTIQKINYYVVCINEFAKKKEVHPKVAFKYLYDYKGLDFLEENYDIEHTLSLHEAIEDLEMICKNNGGNMILTTIH